MELDDSNTTFATVKSLIEKFIQYRDWRKFHTPRNLAESISIESAELLEIFQWTTADEAQKTVKDTNELTRLRGKAADVIIYCLSLSNATGIDIVKALVDKIRKKMRRSIPTKFSKELTQKRAEVGMIPGGINRNHVLSALDQIKKSGVPEGRESTKLTICP